jgi:tetratricopeptide (TPR) repeat protein
MPESTPSNVEPSAAPAAGGQLSISETERKRLQKCFLAGEQKAAGNVDYAIEMFATCVLGDPASPLYLQSFFAVLKKKFAGKKAGGLSALFSAGARGGLKKLAAAEQWIDLLKKGVELLKSTPHDHATLLAMANACRQLNFQETQPIYLRAALDAAPADAEVNRVCAEYLEARGEYDQAIACWRRIAAIKGMAEEAERTITKLQVDKTFAKGRGLDGRGGAKPEAKTAADTPSDKPRLAVLRDTLAKDPANVEAALELADLLEKEETIDAAEQVLRQALAASGNDLKVREHLEDRQLRWARHRVHVAEQQVAADDTPQHRQTLEQLRSSQIRQEIEVYRARSDRYPENMTWRYELALRLKADGNYDGAIKEFQAVLQDDRRKGAVALELGECFQKIKQYQLAFQSYQTAVDALTDREADLRKRALYRAGVLAMGLKDVDSAQKYLSTLAGIDFGYRDVADRLDKLKTVKHKEVEETDE